MSAQAIDPIKFFWKPGCSSCLRTKEFLVRHAIAFESVNAEETPGALHELRALGARGLPVIVQGGRFTLCQSFPDVLRFLNIAERPVAPLAPAQLIDKLALVLQAAMRITRQFPPAQLGQTFRNRNRTQGALAFHIFRVVEMGIGALQHQGLDVDGFNDLPSPSWSGQDIADWGQQVHDQAMAWWHAQQDRDLQYLVETYYGRRSAHDVLERMTWHAAQHTRQLALMLESGGTAPERPLTAEQLRGLPVPDEVWG